MESSRPHRLRPPSLGRTRQDVSRSGLQGVVEAGLQLVEFIADDGESGKDFRRPGLRRALEMIAAGEVSGLIACKLDRITRSVLDFATLLPWFDEAGATLVALDLGIDTSTSGGRLVANVFASVAEWKREVIASGPRTGLPLCGRRPCPCPARRWPIGRSYRIASPA